MDYFFEQDLIFRICLKRIKIHQINSEVIYSDETSSLNVLKSILTFLFYHLQNFIQKLIYQMVKKTITKRRIAK